MLTAAALVHLRYCVIVVELNDPANLRKTCAAYCI
jgi:hypothetical protein